MIDRAHDLPLIRQARALGISRGSVYYLPRAVPAADLALMRAIDALHLEYPFAGIRRGAGRKARPTTTTSRSVDATSRRQLNRQKEPTGA